MWPKSKGCKTPWRENPWDLANCWPDRTRAREKSKVTLRKLDAVKGRMTVPTEESGDAGRRLMSGHGEQGWAPDWSCWRARRWEERTQRTLKRLHWKKGEMSGRETRVNQVKTRQNNHREKREGDLIQKPKKGHEHHQTLLRKGDNWP